MRLIFAYVRGVWEFIVDFGHRVVLLWIPCDPQKQGNWSFSLLQKSTRGLGESCVRCRWLEGARAERDVSLVSYWIPSSWSISGVIVKCLYGENYAMAARLGNFTSFLTNVHRFPPWTLSHSWVMLRMYSVIILRGLPSSTKLSDRPSCIHAIPTPLVAWLKKHRFNTLFERVLL